jgi:hypothetical protein
MCVTSVNVPHRKGYVQEKSAYLNLNMICITKESAFITLHNGRSELPELQER